MPLKDQPIARGSIGADEFAFSLAKQSTILAIDCG